MAFSSEVDSGSREENASNKNPKLNLRTSAPTKNKEHLLEMDQ
jgi:hypothetical protein